MIPFFYLVKVKPKLKWYVLMLLLPLACLELVDLPFQIYAGLAAWGVVEINDMINKYVFGRHVLAIAFTLLLMPRYRRFLIGKNPK